jgi:hypothetical protein
MMMGLTTELAAAWPWCGLVVGVHRGRWADGIGHGGTNRRTVVAA